MYFIFNTEMKPLVLIIAFFITASLQAQQTRVIADCTIHFAVISSAQKELGSKVIYIKGREMRVDFISSVYSQTMITGKNGEITLFKTVGQSKYIANYTPDEWKKQNEIYAGIKTNITAETKKILDYTCKKAILTLKTGNSYTVYFVPGLVPSVKENVYEFNDVPGLILEYESIDTDNKKVTYTATKIDFKPVPAAQFEIPKSGYRVLH